MKLYCPDCSELLQITGMPYCKPLYCKNCNKSYNYTIKLSERRETK